MQYNLHNGGSSPIELHLRDIAIQISREISSYRDDFKALFEEEPVEEKDSIFKFTFDIMGEEKAKKYKYQEIFPLLDSFYENIVKDMGLNIENPEDLLQNPHSIIDKIYDFFRGIEKLRKERNDEINSIIRNFDKSKKKEFLIRLYGSKAVDKSILKSLVSKERNKVGLTNEWKNKHIKYKERLIGKLDKTGKKMEFEGPVVTYERILKKIKKETEEDVGRYIH